MSFPCTLDEISSEVLVEELLARYERRNIALQCAYCKKSLVDREGKPITKLHESIGPCSCRFGDIDKYHSPNILVRIWGVIHRSS